MAASAEKLRGDLLNASLATAEFWNLGDRPSPIDIARELCRAMEVGRFSKRGKTFVQTVYSVLLSEPDFERFDSRSRELVATLKDALAWWARSNAYEAPGEIRVLLRKDESLERGQLSIEAGLRPDESRKLGRLRNEN
ncbi:MAG: FhaA domain-containing protein [Actinomycetota bacterium]